MPMRLQKFLPLLLLLCTGAVRAETPQSIPFEFVDGFILLKAQLDSPHETVNMILDSGAGASVVSLESAHRLKLKLGRPQPVRGVSMQTTAYELNHLSASAGGVALGRISLAVDLSNARELCSRPIDGLIGIDFFRDQTVEIDFNARVIRTSASLPAADAASKLPLRSMNGTYCIPIRVNGSKQRWARLDTGCNDSLHWTVPRARDNNVRSNLSIGFLTDASDLEPSELQIGSHALSKVETSLHTQPLFPGESGLVGTGVLSRFITTVDVPHGQVFFRPAKPF
jgi:hypothetical protein